MRRLIAALLLLAGTAIADPGSLYLNGVGAEVRLGEGAKTLPAGQFACAGCHGADGLGRQEGGTEFPAIDWASLSDPARVGGAYDEAAFLRAVQTGIGADGRRLSAAMPRYQAGDAVFDQLLADVKRLSTDQRLGIGPATVRLCPAGEAMSAGYALAAKVVNAEGGVFGRSLVVDCDGPAFATGAEVATALDVAVAQAEAALIAATPSPVLRIADLDGPPPKGARLLSLRADLARPALDAGLPILSHRPYLDALLLAEALRRCGRAVTRACAVEALGRIDIELYLALYGP